MAQRLGHSVTRWPAPYLVAVIAVTIGLGFAATGLKSELSIKDVLSRGGSVLEDMNTLEVAVGGSTELASVLLKAEATETRTFLNLRDLTAAFNDELRRPKAAAGPIQSSYYTYLTDWIDDSEEAGDKCDPELAALFQDASAGLVLDRELMQDLLDQLAASDPGLEHSLLNNPGGIDMMLLQFPAYLDNPKQSRALQEDIEALWRGDDSVLTVTSDSIVAVSVTDQITDGQTAAISTTIAVALGILAIFFWVTLRQPALGFVAVAPIVLVLISVLGTMALLDIPYTLITSIITALSIGIGVDYTIHVIHRYREEFTGLRNPEKAAVQTLATTGSALLGSALTTAFGFGVLIASPLLASQQFGIHGHRNHRILTDSLYTGGAARDGCLGCLLEHADALHGRANVGRPRRSHRGRVPASRARRGTTLTKEAYAIPPTIQRPEGLVQWDGSPQSRETLR